MAGYQVGQLEIFSLAKPVVSGITTISGSWACKIQGSAASPLLLRMIEIYSTGGVNDVSLAIMTVNDGSPNASNAFLAWNTDVPMGGKWSWTGEVPLIDRYIYAKRNAAGATLQMFWQVEELNP
jgi:hypothetical protein